MGTASNWDPAIQHGSPPLALMTKAIEERAELARTGSGLRIGRLTLDILGAIPVAPVKVRAWVDRPGSRISLLYLPRCSPPDPTAPTGPSHGSTPGCSAPATQPTSRPIGIPHSSRVMRYRPRTRGQATPVTWRRSPGARRPTAPGRSQRWCGSARSFRWCTANPLTDVQRLAMVVDSANGVGSAIEPNRIRVHEHRHLGASASRPVGQ